MKIAIAGAGKLGIKIAEALLSADYSVTIIDKNEALLQKLSSHMDIMTVWGNAKEISVLEDIDISTYDFFLGCTSSDEKNIVICNFAKRLGCQKVIARVRDPEHLNQFDFIKEAMSIDYIMNPDLAITLEMFKYLVEKYTLSNGIFSSGKIAIIEFNSDRYPLMVGKSLEDLNSLFEKMLIVAISRNGKIIIPEKEEVIQSDDSLYVIGEKQPIIAFNKIVHEKKKYTDLQRVMIAGGGKIGFYLAQMLSEFGISVKIIEVDKARCQYLSSHLVDVLVLHGDATDMDLLEEENIDEMDAFVTTTGYDEENLLLALMAKNRGIEDVIAKISRESYGTLIQSMGIDMALNPLDMTCTNVLRYIQGSKKVLSSQLIQGQAEIIEIIADENMRLINTPLKNLNMPEGFIIGAIHRGTKVIIPDGNTMIEEGDRVIIVSLLREIPILESLLKTEKSGFFR